MSIVARNRAAVALIALFGISCAGDHTSPSGPQVQPASERAAALTILSSASTTAFAGDTVRVPVLVTDGAGHPVSNATVYFVLDSKMPGAFAAVSDSTGVATGLPTAPSKAGDYVAEASLSRTLPNGTVTVLTARYDVHVRGGIATRVTHPVPSQLVAYYQGATLSTPEYTAYDRFGNPATSGVLTFRSLPDGTTPLTAETPDSLGRVKSQPWTLGATIGTYRLIASIQSFEDTVSAFVASGPPARIEPETTPLVVGVDQAPIRKPTVIVRDADGRGVPSAEVTWSDSTGVLAGCASKTSINGVASIGCSWVAGSAGESRLSASVGALSTTITVKVLAKPATFEVISGPEPGSTIRIGSAVDITLRLRLANGDPAVGYAIDAYPLFTTVTTDASGIARYRWALAPYVVPQTITFTVDVFPELRRSIAVRTLGEPRYYDISAGGAHTCASTGVGSLIYTDMAVICWGGNAQGQLGDGTTVSRTVPTAATAVPLGTVPGFFNVAAGAAHTCAARTSYPTSAYASGTPSALLCWGGNAAGQSGAPASASIDATEMGSTLTAPAAGATHSCAMPTMEFASGRNTYYETTGVQCWGDNTFGELGDGTLSSRFRPADVVSPALAHPSQVTAGDGFTCARNGAGEVYCWGKNSDGQLGDGTTNDRNTPVLVAGGLHFGAISAGSAHACGIVNPGQIYCWGRNDAGQLGDGTMISRSAPTLVVGAQSFTAVAAGGAHTCALTSSGSAFCWGDNRFGQLGNGTTANSPQPVGVAGGASFSRISAGRSHTCSLPVDSGVGAFCWGLNANGQLGDGTTTNRSTPTRVAEYLSTPPPSTASAAPRSRRR